MRLNWYRPSYSSNWMSRPPWHADMPPDELDAQERTSFLEWRRGLVRLEENEALVLTPFEKNLDIWRQLWRVAERSDLVAADCLQQGGPWLPGRHLNREWWEGGRWWWWWTPADRSSIAAPTWRCESAGKLAWALAV